MTESSTPPGPQDESAVVSRPRERRRARGRLMIGAAVLATVVAAGGVVPLPYYVVRWGVLPRLESATGGRVVVGDWSAGWSSGLTLRDVRVTDAGGREAAAVGRFQCEFSPWQALRGRYVLGKATADGVRVRLRVDAGGGTSFDGLWKGGDTPLLLSAGVEAKIEGVTVDLPGVETIDLGAGSLSAAVDTAGQALTHTLDLSRVHVAGRSTVFQDGRLLPADRRTVEQTVKFQDVAVRTAWWGSDAAGGELHWTVDGQQGAATLEGTLRASRPSFVLHGDTLRLGELSAPVSVRRAADGRLTVERLAINSPEGTATVEGEFSPGSIENLLHARPPGSSGRVHVTARVNDLPAVAGQLPHVLALAKDARVTGGHLSHELTATWTGEAVTLSAGGELAAEGTKGGRPVSIAPVTVAVSGVARPAAGGGWPEVSGVSAAVHSPFMTVDARAESLASVHATGNLSLDKLVQQVGQFVDLSGLTAAGTGEFTVETGGSFADAGRPVDVRASVNLEGVKVLLPTGRVVIDEPHLAFSGSTQVDRAAAAAGAGQLRRLDVKLQSRSGSVAAAGESLAALDFTADLDLAKLREQLGTVVDLGAVQVGGRAAVRASTRGDLSRVDSPIATKVSAHIESGSVAGLPGLAPLAPTNVALDASADVRRGAGGVLAGLANAAATLAVGDPADPSIGLVAGGEVDLAAGRVPQFTVSRLTADLPFVEHLLAPLLLPVAERVQVPRGRATVAAAGSWDGRTLALAKPAAVEVQGLSVGPVGLSEEGLPVRDETLTLSVGGRVSAERGVEATLSELSVASTSKLLDFHLEKAQPLVVRVTPGQAPRVTGAVGASADLGRLSRAAGPLLGLSAESLGPQARVEGSVTLAAAGGQGQAVEADAKFTHVTLPPYLSDAPVQVAGKAAVTAAAVDFAGSVESPAASGMVANGRYLLKRSSGQPTAGWLEGLARLDVAGTVRDLPAAYAAVAGPAAPVTVGSGQLSGRASLVREGAATAVRLADVKASGVSVRAGGQVVHDGDASLGGMVVLESAASDPGRLAGVRVSGFRAALGPTEVALVDTLSLTDLGMPVPTVAGSVRAAGPVGPAWQAAAGVLGIPSVAAGGEYVLTQQVSTAAGRLHLAGGVTVSNLAIKQGERTLFADPRVSVTDDGDYDPATGTVSANSVKVSPSTGAVAVEAKGRVIDWRGSRQLDQVSVGVDYDWAKVWPLVLPLLPGEQQAQLKDLKVAGQHHAAVDVRGSLPSGADPLRTLAVSTTVSAAAIDLGTYAVRDLVLPLTLQDGQVRTVYADGHAGPPAKFNGGTADLSEWTIDLNGSGGPRFTLPRNKVVLSDVKVDAPLAAEWLGGYCPLFAGAREAEGRLSVTVADCTNVDPGQLGVAGASAQGQKVELLFTVNDLRMAGTFTDVLHAVIDPPGFNAVTSVRDGHVTLQDGQAVTDMSLRLNPAGGSDLNFKSTVRLSDRTLMPMTVAIPKGVLTAARQAGPGALNNLPDKVDLPIDGTTDHPQPRVDALTKQIQDAAAKAAQVPAAAAPAGH